MTLGGRDLFKFLVNHFPGIQHRVTGSGLQVLGTENRVGRAVAVCPAFDTWALHSDLQLVMMGIST